MIMNNNHKILLKQNNINFFQHIIMYANIVNFYKI